VRVDGPGLLTNQSYLSGAGRSRCPEPNDVNSTRGRSARTVATAPLHLVQSRLPAPVRKHLHATPQQVVHLNLNGAALGQGVLDGRPLAERIRIIGPQRDGVGGETRLLLLDEGLASGEERPLRRAVSGPHLYG